MVADHFYGEFNHLNSVDYGISPGNKVYHGMATVGALLSRIGQPMDVARYFLFMGIIIMFWLTIYKPVPVM